MPFPNDVFIGTALRASYRCEMCNADVSFLLPRQSLPSFHIHSVTGLHLVQSDSQKTMCVVTCPPERLERMRGLLLQKYGFIVFGLGRSDDGYCLCHACHAGIHNIALNETKLIFPGYTGRNSAPAVLEKVSLFFIQRGRF